MGFNQQNGDFNGINPLVICSIAIKNGPVDIVDFPINSMVDLSSSLCVRLPEGIDSDKNKHPMHSNTI